MSHTRRSGVILALFGWMIVGGVLGCAGGAAPSQGAKEVDRPVEAKAAVRDYATELAEWVESSQGGGARNGANRWQEYTSAVTRVCGAWEYFTLSNPVLSAHLAADPDKNYPAADPLVIVTSPDLKTLVPEVESFFRAVEQSKVMGQMDRVAGPASFVALRNVDLMVETSMPELGETRLYTKICAARMRLAAMQGRPEEGLRWLKHGLAATVAAQGRGVLMAYLAAAASRGTLEQEIRDELMLGKVSAEAAKAMLELLAAYPLPEVLTALKAERLVTLESIDRYFEKAEEEAIRPDGVGYRARASLQSSASQVEQREKAEAFFARMDGLQVSNTALIGEIEAMAKDVRSPSDGRSYRPMSMALPNVPTAMEVHRKLLVQHAGTRGMLALEISRAKAGGYPERLEQLVPDVLDRVPEDPCAPGRALGYRLLKADGVSLETGYLLYSVGTDGEDQGGKERAEQRLAALGSRGIGAGFDYVINSTRP